MREVEKLVNLVVVYTVPPAPASVARAEVPAGERVLGGYFERSIAGFLESAMEDGEPGRQPAPDREDVNMNRIEVEQAGGAVKDAGGSKRRRRRKKQAGIAEEGPGHAGAESSIGLADAPASDPVDVEFPRVEASFINDVEVPAAASLVDEPSFTKIYVTDIKGSRPHAEGRGLADDSNIRQDWFIHTPDPSRAVSKIIDWYNLFADISPREDRPVPPPGVSGILRLGSDARAVSGEEPLVSVDILSTKFRYCKHKAIDKIQVNLRDIRNAIPHKQLNSWGLVFSRVFNIHDFCNDNRRVPLHIILRHLALLDIEPALFMKSRTLGFYNQDVDALSLARDISYYAMVYGIAGLQLSYLAEYVEDLIAEQSGDKSHVELYSVIKLLKRMSSPYMKSSKDVNINNSKHIYVYNDRISINGLTVESGLSFKIRSNLKQSLGSYSGYRRIRALYVVVTRYQSTGIHITFSAIEQLFKSEHISHKDTIAAVCLMERLRMAVPPRLMGSYRRIIRNVSFLLCSALNTALKRGESPNLYGVIRGVVDPNNLRTGQASSRGHEPHNPERAAHGDLPGPAADGSTHNSYASERFIRDITAVYVRRIRKSKNIRELEPIYGSILQFNELFGTVWPIEAELLQAVRAHAVRDAGGWPSGKFGEKIRQILSE